MIRRGILLLLPLVCLANLSSVLALSAVYASLPPILIGTDADDTTPNNIDIANLYFTNDGTRLTFILGLFDFPRTNGGQRYYIYLNTVNGQGATTGPPGYVAGSDYYMVWHSSGAYLYKWDVFTSTWVQTNSTVTIDYVSQVDTLMFSGTLSDIGHPWSNQQDMGVTAVTVVGNSPKDRSRDSGIWTITYAVIPEFPGVTLPIFMVALMVTVSLLYKHKFRSTVDSTRCT